MPIPLPRPRRHSFAGLSCFTAASAQPVPRSPPASPTTTNAFRRFSQLGDRAKRARSPGPGEGDMGISYPWNFEHLVHVDESLNGLPPKWSSLLEEAESEYKKSAVVVTQPAVPTRRCRFYLVKCCKLHNTKQKTEQGGNATHAQVEGDEGISLPWNVKHHTHVDENFNGLPPTWAVMLQKTTREGATLRATGGDPSITLPWNFQHQIHVIVDEDGLPRGLPEQLAARLSEVGYTEVEIAAIHANSA
ncbi:hypothetical protein WOLCODRAFT_138204 [Wolfiporia cocos MD-104 SS10]|uniref:CRIB domain-containing protein n=1 Tax=Wolfiporia cocos (strain MD-104) TaxID=742152 RepID=A0A2H3JNQ1_WOLCO|nr:hypothetical protein WOLCODRAFT_138204 [Wolfiporia cocos MD-104 SS10]